MEISNGFLILVPIIVGLVKVAKVAKLQSRYAPLLSLALGVAGASLLVGFSGGAVLGGLIAGLTASGLFSGVKATVA